MTAIGGRAAGGRTIDTSDASALTKVRRSKAGTALTDAAISSPAASAPIWARPRAE